MLSVEDKNSIELLYSIGYAFPHSGKILSIVFIPFAAWFYGNEISLAQYPMLLVSGLASYFGGPIVAIPYLLDQWQLPHDMFQLFLLTGVLGERVGDAVGVMHLAVRALVTFFAMRGDLKLRAIGFLKFAFVSVVCCLLVLVGARATLNETFELAETKSQIIAQMQLIEEPSLPERPSMTISRCISLNALLLDVIRWLCIGFDTDTCAQTDRTRFDRKVAKHTKEQGKQYRKETCQSLATHRPGYRSDHPVQGSTPQFPRSHQTPGCGRVSSGEATT